MTLPLAVSMGDPAGVGPVVSVRAVAALPSEETALLFGDADLLERVAREEGIAHDRIVRAAEGSAVRPGALTVVHVASCSAATVAARRPTPEGGVAQLAALDAALDRVRTGRARALVTAPISKEAVASGGERFVGQTERCAQGAGLAADAVTMMFLGPRLAVGLATTHVAVRDVADRITTDRVARSCTHLAEALCTLDPDAIPTVLVAGLNPHAGEGGLFGDEEARVIAPALVQARARGPYAQGRAVLEGVVGAETAFRRAAAGDVAGVVAMMHDQATIASKLLDFGSAANVTWGLPFVRTSPDHGVAYDAAARGTADESGMAAALDIARRLTRERPL